MNYDVVIVGSGMAGAVLARRSAEEKGWNVLVVERRDQIGGYCYDFRNEDGILVQRFGPHIFRTNSKMVWDFLSRFTEWHEYQHKVLTYVQGRCLPMPINLDTVNGFLGTHYTSENVMEYFETCRTHPKEVLTVMDSVESQVGKEFYENFYKNYTEKQWGESCEKLPAEILARIPIRKNRDDRYFTHKYQALPADGYTAMIRNMLSHPNIHILLNADYREVKDDFPKARVFYSGSIDEFFGFCYGRLPYRCVRFEFETIRREWYQEAAVVNYPNNYDFTRITEFKHLYRDKRCESTVIAREYPSSDGDPSYPLPFAQCRELYERYLALKPENVEFIGRLGRYRYYSMDQIVEEILSADI